MYISDKNAIQYTSRVVLLVVPFFSSLFLSWSWIIEILVIFALFIHVGRWGLRLTINFLTIGYLASIIPLGIAGLTQIGYTPWAGILLLVLREKGLSLGRSVFWSLVLAVMLSALPTIPNTVQALQPDILQQRIEENILFYEQTGTIEAFEKQGLSKTEFEEYLRLAMSAYYKLLPGLAGILSMIEIGLGYLAFRFFQRKEQKEIPFALWRLPWYAVWLAIIGVAMYLGGDFFSYNTLTIVGMNTMLIIGGIAVILGLACAAYFFQHPKVPRVLMWIAIFSAVFFTPYVLLILLFIGLFDLVFNFRRIPEKSEGA
ncbi:MAG: hypothetical protein APF84_04530 [Gracilibacter sp. BRH_c7a]|nr:MAG: hypothetical protein APF84_04530 [Gracilibacter sp. BRH_c7a]